VRNPLTNSSRSDVFKESRDIERSPQETLRLHFFRLDAPSQLQGCSRILNYHVWALAFERLALLQPWCDLTQDCSRTPRLFRDGRFRLLISCYDHPHAFTSRDAILYQQWRSHLLSSPHPFVELS